MHSLIAVTAQERNVAELIGPMIDAMGFELVRVRVGSGGRRKQLQIMAERQEDGSMEIDDCADISKAVSAILDVEEPIKEAFTLEVSSPGIDRPLTRLKDFEIWRGHLAKIQMLESIDGRRSFKGVISNVNGTLVNLQVEGQEWELEFTSIANAKLVMTNDLLRQNSTEEHETRIEENK